MIIKTLTRGQAQEEMKIWVKNYPELPFLEEELLVVREDIGALYTAIKEEIDEDSNIKKLDYSLDYKFGLALYDYLSKQLGFSLRVASDDGFWRFLSLKVVPHIVAQRWGKDNDSHYWSQPTRIWLRSIWWFVHLSWQGDLESTRQVLSCKHFTTDTILNFEERTGRKGTYVEAYRKIIKIYSELSSEVIKSNSRSKNGKSDDIFRVVMKLNTAKIMVMDPDLCAGGVEGYALSLFKDAGVNLDVT